MQALLNASSMPLSRALGFPLTCVFMLHMNSLVNGNMGSMFWADLLTARRWILGYDRNAANYTDGTKVYNFQNQYHLPAASSKIFLNLTSNFNSPLNISQNDAIRVILFTSLTNKFEHVFLPPVPIIKVNVDSEQIGTVFQDVLSLDSSDSVDREGTIIDYRWQVGNSTNSTNGTSILGNLSGQKATMPFNLNNTGKFWIYLNVTDSNGMQGSASWASP